MAELLKPHFRELHQQENFFFDGTSQEMSKAKLALRTRFYGVDKHAVITLKVGMHQCTRQAIGFMHCLAPKPSDTLSRAHRPHFQLRCRGCGMKMASHYGLHPHPCSPTCMLPVKKLGSLVPTGRHHIGQGH